MKKSFETILYSVAGVAILLVIIIAFNGITAPLKARIDLTQDHAYTLSPGTRAILQGLDTPIKIRFYYSHSENSTPETLLFKTYAQHVEDLLDEYKQVSKGKITIEKYDPQPDSDAEDSARLDGIDGQMLPTGEKFYLGLCVSLLDTKSALPFLDPDRERLLEYDLSRAIATVVTPEKPVVGVMSALPVFGNPGNPMMASMGQGGEAQEPWVFIKELQGDYNVKKVEMDAGKIPDDVKVLVVIHPRDISDSAQYAIDQFVMRGGKLIAFLDPLSLLDREKQSPAMGESQSASSSLDKLLGAWGLQFDTKTVVADLNDKMKVVRDNQENDVPVVLSITGDGINKDDVTTSELSELWYPFGGAFTGAPADGLKETVLLKSTKDSQLVDGMMAGFSTDAIEKNFKPSGLEYALAIRLTGKFKTAFPAGKPKAAKDDQSKSAEPADTNEPQLKETKGDNSVVLFGDSDLLADQYSLRQVNTLFGPQLSPANGNLTLGENLVEQFAGNENLITVRSRATQRRPFTRIVQMEAKAEENYQSKVQELEDSLKETQDKLNELQRGRQDGAGQQQFILSPEQQKELESFKQKEASVGRQLKLEKKKLTHDINALENRLKWANIIGMPALVALTGLGLAALKHKRTSAK